MAVSDHEEVLEEFLRIDSFVGLAMTASDGLLGAAERRRRSRDERQAILREMEKDLAGPPPFRVTLAEARAKWPEWEAAHNDRRVKSRHAVEERLGAVVANLLVDIHLPELPPPTEIIAYALDLECGHEDFRLVKRDSDAKPTVDRAPCPIFWKCQLSDGRTAVSYIEPSEPKEADSGWGLTRWSVTLACGHQGQVLQRGTEESRIGDFVLCRACAPGDPDADVEIVACGERLPDLMVQDWTIQLSCGHVATDYRVPVEFKDDPATYRAQNLRRKGHRCIDRACDERKVRGIRRLGVLGKILAPMSTPARLDPVAEAAMDLRLRLTKEQRQALIRQLHDEQ